MNSVFATSARTSSRRFLEVAVAWVGDVDAACGAGGNELDRGGLCDAGAFVADEVDVVATVIDKGHVPGVHRMAVMLFSNDRRSGRMWF